MKKTIASIMLAASLASAVEVGVLGFAGQKCPSGNSYDFYVFLDTEDHKSTTGVSGDNQDTQTPAGFRIGKKKNVHIFFCIMDSRNLRPVPYDYAVLRYDMDCPNGAKKFRRHHDTEDSDNCNSSGGSIWPSAVYRDVDLEFCYMPATPGATAEFPLDGQYGVFADYKSNAVARSVVRIDDEDSKNKNGWNWYGATSNEQRLIKRIVEPYDEKRNGHEDTRYHVSWRMASLAKLGGVDAPAVAEVAADKPVAAELKGFDHSSVSFELKSAGNAVVSIVNINGAVVAKVSKENLQPGVHSVEWHSGIVPNGRYVVTIEHNGVTSGKNVILK